MNSDEWFAATGWTTGKTSKLVSKQVLRPQRKYDIGDTTGNPFVFDEKDVLVAKAVDAITEQYAYGALRLMLMQMVAKVIYEGQVKNGEYIVVGKPVIELACTAESAMSIVTREQEGGVPTAVFVLKVGEAQ